MRIYPPVWGIARKSNEENRFAGYKIPKDSYIAISIYDCTDTQTIGMNPRNLTLVGLIVGSNNLDILIRIYHLQLDQGLV